MAEFLHRGAVTIWALLASLIVHILIIAALSLIKFSNSGAYNDNGIAPVIAVNHIQAIIEKEVVLPKPKIKQIFVDKDNTIEVKKPSEKINVESQPETLKIIKEVPAKTESVSVEIGTVTANTEFFGSKTSNRKICYVVDCSGSMHGRLAILKAQLKKSLESLSSDQYFYFIFFSGNNNIMESGQGKMIRAVPEAKAAASKFIDRLYFEGTSDSISALKRAFEISDQQSKPPEQIYFLTDGFGYNINDAKKFAGSIEKMRKELAPSVKINTIGMWTQPEDKWLLKTIAADSGGEFEDIH